MKIVVTSTGEGMDAAVDPHFGRCSYFAIVDIESGDLEAIANPYQDASGGAGTQAAQFLIDKGVGALLTGHCGPKASEVLEETDIEIVSGVNKGTVREAVNTFRESRRPQTAQLATDAEGAPGPGSFGGAGRGGRGAGGGRGRGPGGGGRGAGGGRGRGPGGGGRGR